MSLYRVFRKALLCPDWDNGPGKWAVNTALSGSRGNEGPSFYGAKPYTVPVL